MKRSEMIKLMVDSWYEWVNTPKNIEKYGLKAAHTHLLHKMEEAGMLPPIRHNIAQGSDDAIMSLKWEPEEDDSPSAESVEDATTEEEH